MIRIHLPESIGYSRLRREYLNRISEYVEFDRQSIFPEEGSSKRKSHVKGKTEAAAEKLRQHFHNLYQFLFQEDTGEVNTENLRWLLAGPEIPPESFGGVGGYSTMNESLKAIIEKCAIGEDETKALETCKEIFKYNQFVRNKEDAYWPLRELGVRVCPYCNRIYTTTLPTKEELDKEESGREFMPTRATYDHFYSQAQYPYLALSLFNLIPSCNICNQNKSDKDREIIYPYDEEFGKNVVFRLVPELEKKTQPGNGLHFLTGESDRFHVKMMGKSEYFISKDTCGEYCLSDIEDNGYRNRIIGSIQIFHIEELYDELKPEIMDILRNRYYFNEEYIESVLCPLLKERMRRVGRTMSDEQVRCMAMEMVFNTRIHPEEWKDRPLSKLKSDIIDYIDDLNENSHKGE